MSEGAPRSEADVVVLGLGGMGAAALCHLAQRGVRAVGIEQHDVPHAFGSSHGSSRVIRKAYFEDARYVPILERSYALWRALEEECTSLFGAPAASLYTRTGCVNLGPSQHPEVRALVETCRVHALAHEVLDARAIRARFPAFRVDDDVIGVFEQDAGVLHPERCTAAHAALAKHHGARVHTNERVVRVRVHADGVDVVTSARTIACGHLVVAAGPWLPELARVFEETHAPASAPAEARESTFGQASVALSKIAGALHVTRQVQLWFAPPAREEPASGTTSAFAAAAFPVFIQFTNDRSGAPCAYYGMPPLGGDGVKVCRHGGGVRTSPDTVDRALHDDDVDDVRAYLRSSLPSIADAPVTRSAVCMYTMTPDAHFVVGRASERVVVLGGFSGHGYKMASAIGECAADLVTAPTHGRECLDLSLFDPGRLR